jgi:peptide subunit release factor 1 (eRF1)
MLRNQIPVEEVITDLLMLTVRHEFERLRFCCPLCYHYETSINPKANLARCFDCKKNFNPIDLVIAVEECSFMQAVEKLKMELFRKKIRASISE